MYRLTLDGVEESIVNFASEQVGYLATIVTSKLAKFWNAEPPLLKNSLNLSFPVPGASASLLVRKLYSHSLSFDRVLLAN